jgi:prepilin-type N-terminal cleavage/methylation domain-containing protein
VARMIGSKLRRQDGFTLIELIVVVAILGILAAVLTPRVLDAMDSAKRNGALAFGKEIQLAMERYYVDSDNGYPSVDEMKKADEDDAKLEYSDLVSILSAYSSLDAAQFSSGVTFAYTSTDEKDYSMTVGLADSGKTVTITPTSVTIAE